MQVPHLPREQVLSAICSCGGLLPLRIKKLISLILGVANLAGNANAPDTFPPREAAIL